MESEIVPGIPFSCPGIFPHVFPECHHHVDDNRRAQRKKRSVHKILPDPAGGDTYSLPDGSANTKGVPFHHAFEFIHVTNLENLTNPVNRELFRYAIFVISQQFNVLIS